MAWCLFFFNLLRVGAEGRCKLLIFLSSPHTLQIHQHTRTHPCGLGACLLIPTQIGYQSNSILWPESSTTTPRKYGPPWALFLYGWTRWVHPSGALSRNSRLFLAVTRPESTLNSISHLPVRSPHTVTTVSRDLT